MFNINKMEGITFNYIGGGSIKGAVLYWLLLIDELANIGQIGGFPRWTVHRGSSPIPRGIPRRTPMANWQTSTANWRTSKFAMGPNLVLLSLCLCWIVVAWNKQRSLWHFCSCHQHSHLVTACVNFTPQGFTQYCWHFLTFHNGWVHFTPGVWIGHKTI